MTSKKLMTFGVDEFLFSKVSSQGLQRKFLMGVFFIPWECIVWFINQSCDSNFVSLADGE